MTAQWDAQGATVTPRTTHLMLNATDATIHLTHAQIAALEDHEVSALDLPRLMDAVIAVTIEGRIDVPAFRLSLSVEPFNHMHPWAVYRRVGAALFVGERVVRLNRQQFTLFNAYDHLLAAGTDVAARLRAWRPMADALRFSSEAHVIIHGHVPPVRIQTVERFPTGAMTRSGNRLRRANAVPDALWAMDAGYKYYLRQAPAK